MGSRKFLQGNEALAQGALYAGCRFFGGYPITPSSEIAEELARELPTIGGKFIQMEDEIASIASVIGASVAGVKSLTATSGPGFSLKMEALGYAYMTEIPLVVVNIQRTGPSTGHPTGVAQGEVMQARWGTHGTHQAITLLPSSVSEMFSETIRAFNLSEKFMTPVIILSDEVIAHMREGVEVPNPGDVEIINRKKTDVSPDDYLPYKGDENGVPTLMPFGEGYRYHITGLYHGENGFPAFGPDSIDKVNARWKHKIEDAYDEIVEVDEYMLSDADTAIFAYGCTAGAAYDAVDKLREKGIKAGLIKPRTIWPFPDRHIAKFSENLKSILVAELNDGDLVSYVKSSAKDSVVVDSLNKLNSEVITPDEIVAKILEASS